MKICRGLVSSIDVTHRCNLSCKHCYFRLQKHFSELGDDEWVERVKWLIGEYGTRLLIILGGEPLLRRDLCIKLNGLLPIWLVTNGTLPIPEVKGRVFVSIDGTEQIHDWIRGRGTYRVIVSNIDELSMPYTVTTVLNAVNYKCMPDLVDEWVRRGAESFWVSLHTPPPYDIVLRGRQREECINMLRKLTSEYGSDVMWFTDYMLDSMLRGDLTDMCGCRRLVVSLDPMGRVKVPCEMAGQDCSMCGLHIAHLLTGVIRGDADTINLALRIMGGVLGG
ncbi:MAG: hypothetical protein DRO39_04275 [Thermoprotei archaeon]|nr:MAG: hypothetical protein DRO39_04275 [Thermoprotei archaeon]